MTNNPPRHLSILESKTQGDAFCLRLAALVEAYRCQGYRRADLDPLGGLARAEVAELAPQFHGLDARDAVPAQFVAGLPAGDVAALVRRLQAIYSGPLGLDASAVRDAARRQWLHARMEADHAAAALAPAQTQALLRRLADAEAWEQHVRERYPQGKRFSLEGCESLLPLMDALVEAAAAHGISKLFLGMPHRGRLNLLVHLLGCPPEQLLAYFDDAAEPATPVRDLVYHLGGESAMRTLHGEVGLVLAHNPSHLQSVYPVVAGMARAFRDDAQQSACGAAILLHGDAAFAGQGVVMETLNLTHKPGYDIGGVVHVIVNNQIGFTTPNPLDLQANLSCSDVARLVDAPVLHVNADHPEQVLRAARMAFDYRCAFGVDIVIDLVGYRRLGHAEQDIAAVTQPQTQARIDRHPTVSARYGAALRLPADQLAAVQTEALAALRRPAGDSPFRALDFARPSVPASAPTQSQLQALVAAMTALPEGLELHPLLQQLRRKWAEMVADEHQPADWRFAENMAYATLLSAGHGLRLSGMDVGRGTFMHRHAVWHGQAEGRAETLLPLARLGAGQGPVDIVNSPLSEEAVLGFEYGYSLQSRRRLLLWEAQYGDFVNGAQIMIDQYLASGEDKWGYRSALVVLLPHGQEGVGPEHSNGYLGRFLQLCAEGNLRVAMPSDSAQWFHLLRRQALAEERKPLVVMTPKAQLYGNQASHAPLARLLHGEFEPVLADPAAPAAQQVRRVVLCSGKLFYELQAARAAAPEAYAGVALLRLEQLYPFPTAALAAALAPFQEMRTLVWAQEEDGQQGAWQFLRDDLEAALPAGATLRKVCRRPSASGARSSQQSHRQEQAALVAAALATA